MKEDYTLKTGNDYTFGKGLVTDIKNTVKESVPFASKEGTKSFLIGVLLDAYRGVNNKILECSLDRYKGLISTETQAKERINVKTK